MTHEQPMLLAVPPDPHDQSLLAALFHLSAQISSELDSEQLAQKIVQGITETVPEVDCAILWRYSPLDDRVHFTSLYATDPNTDAFVAPLRSASVRLGEGCVGEALASGVPITVEDTAELYRAINNVDRPTREAFENYISHTAPVCAITSIPLLTGNQRIGVLELINASGTVPLRNNALAIFQTFANQIAVVLRNAQLYQQLEEQNRRLQAFDAVVTAISSAADLSQLLQQALQVVLNVIGAQSGSIGLLTGTTDIVVLEVQQNLAPEIVERLYVVPITGSPYEEVVRFGQPLVQPLHRSHPWWSIFRNHDVEAVALLPLLAGGTVVGVLLIADRLVTLQQLSWPSLMAVGAQIGFAVANAHLFAATYSERRRLAGVIASIAEGVMICNGSGEIVMANEAAGAIFQGIVPQGMPVEGLTTAYQFRDVNQSDLQAQMTPLGRALRGEVFQDFEILIQAPDGRDIVLSNSGAPLLGENGVIDGGVVVFRDITAHKEHDAARDEFLAVAAHELRAPLAAIKGYTDLLVKREMSRHDATERDIKGIGMLSRQVEHLVLLIDNLLDVSRLDAGRLQLNIQPTDAVALVDASVDRVRAGDGRHEYQVKGPATLPFAADQLRIQQVLTNLISNAARYSPAGTQITVEASTVKCTPDEHHTSLNGECVRISVRDQGPGIPDEIQRRIFQRYYRAPTTIATSGLGLGLYLSKEIVHRHGGRLSLQSTPGQGATFVLELPCEGPSGHE